ncbi:GNAT family N-acetyltransferase [Nocardia brasiliensis]|uniref:GNAT family N-acetyltransferase n=1 Tax=Nocardia brasiliensis TaxID=37326 RepID=A0A6G9XY62_NOCBR|nr:GNAT family N-acetyltransferase [Nocardia brasiliensis]QIS05875.1 GNAT family N-acetyltransferase [Nocardia brasiliensis]
MRIEITTDAAEFRARTESFLLRDPLRHTVVTSSVASHIAGIAAGSAKPRFLSLHADDDTVAGVAMRVQDRDVYLGELPERSAGEVADALAELEPEAAGVEGLVADATDFAERWCARFDIGFHQTYRTRLYRLGALRVPDVPGALRRATESDAELCMEWSEAMYADAGIPWQPAESETIRRRVTAGQLWFWERDGQPVSFAAHQLPVYNWSRIGLVYTPPAHRGRGYASAVTAGLAHDLHADGLDVCLFADVANRTAGKIYQAIGFHPTHEFVHHSFDRSGELSSTAHGSTSP